MFLSHYSPSLYEGTNAIKYILIKTPLRMVSQIHKKDNPDLTNWLHVKTKGAALLDSISGYHRQTFE